MGDFFLNRMAASDIILCCYFPLCFGILHAKLALITMYATVVFIFAFTSLPPKHVPKKGFGPPEKRGCLLPVCDGSRYRLTGNNRKKGNRKHPEGWTWLQDINIIIKHMNIRNLVSRLCKNKLKYSVSVNTVRKCVSHGDHSET